MNLSALSKGIDAVIDGVDRWGVGDPIAARLDELGFSIGERVEVIAIGPIGGDPIAVRIGSSRFALRRNEAERIRLRRCV